MTYVDCSGSGLTTIPAGMPPDTDFLFLHDNFIQNVSRKDIQNALSTNITGLEVAKYYADHYSFKETGYNLQTLYLHNNNIDTVEDGAFADLKSLKTLLLHHNNLESLRQAQFKGIGPSLRRLWVHDAGIEDVEAATFSNLTSLKQLWIYNNGMKFHPRGAYSSLPHDAELRISFQDQTSNTSCCALCGVHPGVKVVAYLPKRLIKALTEEAPLKGPHANTAEWALCGCGGEQQCSGCADSCSNRRYNLKTQEITSGTLSKLTGCNRFLVLASLISLQIAWKLMV